MDIQNLINQVVDKTKNDPSFLEKFKNNPIQAVESVLGIDLPDEMIAGVIETVKAKIFGAAAKGDAAAGAAGDQIKDAGETLGDAAEKAADQAEAAADQVKEKADDAVAQSKEAADQAEDAAKEAAAETKEQGESLLDKLKKIF